MCARRRVAAAASLAWALARAIPAWAFCRATTVATPPDYDPVENGCWTQGQPIAWTAGPVPYAVDADASRQVSLAGATRVARLAFASWNGARCAGGAPPDVRPYDDGPAPSRGGCDASGCDESPPPVHRAVVFDDDAWPHDDAANTLALTTVTFGVDSGVIFDAEVEINSHEHTLTLAEPPPPGTFDLQAILTHEAGHYLGLAHSGDPRAIMFAFYRPGATALTADDVEGICAVYPPPPAGGWSCASDSPRSGPWAGALAAAGLAAAVRLARTARKARRARAAARR